jgi:hypothetical protein
VQLPELASLDGAIVIDNAGESELWLFSTGSGHKEGRRVEGSCTRRLTASHLASHKISSDGDITVFGGDEFIWLILEHLSHDVWGQDSFFGGCRRPLTLCIYGSGKSLRFSMR